MSYIMKLIHSSHLMALVACGAIMATMPVEWAFAGADDPSTYQETCENISVSADILSAECETLGGDTRRSSIKIRGIENEEGILSYLDDLSAASTYQLTCDSFGVGDFGDLLLASCRDSNGKSHDSVIVILGIDNVDGRLTYSD
jgi:hypothetical protein